MKLVSVNGSPHGAEGGTARIGKWLLDACREEGAEVTEFHLADVGVELCNGCGSCMTAGECPVNDGVDEIHAAWDGADLVVFQCPTYVFHVTGLMKTFIDRTAALFHRPPVYGAYGAVVASSAGMGESEVIRYLGGAVQLLGASMVGSVWGTYRPPGRLWEPDAVKARAERLGHDLVAAAREKRDYAAPDDVIATRRFIRELIQANRKIFKADHEWWEKAGWYENLPGTKKPRRNR